MIRGVTLLPLAQPDPLPLVVGIGSLLVAGFVFVIFIVWLRKRMLADRAESSGEALSLGQLKALHAGGRISDSEYEVLRRAALLAAGVPPERVIAEESGDRIQADQAVLPVSAARRAVDGGGLGAVPGYDLTGERLPGSAPPDPSQRSGPPPASDRSEGSDDRTG